MPDTEKQQEILQTILIKLTAIDGKFESANIIDEQTKEEIKAIKEDLNLIHKIQGKTLDRISRVEAQISTTRWAFGVLVSILGLVFGLLG